MTNRDQQEALPAFSRHNVRLPDGSQTVPGRHIIGDSEQLAAVIRLLDIVFPDIKRNKITIADLGCMEGGFSYELARRGYTVTGIEARAHHLERCSALQKLHHGDNLSFVKDNVANLNRYGPFSAVLAFGILYHVENPVELLHSIGSCCRRLLILNTHYARQQVPSRFRHKLGKLTTHEGSRGRWYREWAEDTPQTEVEKMDRTAIDTPRSFWLTRPALLEAIRGAGFTTVLEQFDCHYDMEKAERAISRNARSTFAGIRPASDYSLISDKK